jgi:hypothetical protein
MTSKIRNMKAGIPGLTMQLGNGSSVMAQMTAVVHASSCATREYALDEDGAPPAAHQRPVLYTKTLCDWHRPSHARTIPSERIVP